MAFCGKLPAYVIDICPYGYRLQKINCKLLRLNCQQPLEDSIFQSSKPLRQTKFDFVCLMVIFVQRTTNGTTTAATPSSTLNDFVGNVMRLKTCKILCFDCWITVKCLHIRLFCLE